MGGQEEEHGHWKGAVGLSVHAGGDQQELICSQCQGQRGVGISSWGKDGSPE